MKGSARLRSHAIRVASSAGKLSASLFCDFLVVRLDVVARETPIRGLHSCAALIVELAGIMADVGRHDSFFPARRALEGLIERTAALNPIPREEDLLRQRF